MVPPHCPDWMAKLMASCNAHIPEARPSFEAIKRAFDDPSASDAGKLSVCIDKLLQASEQVMMRRVERTCMQQAQSAASSRTASSLASAPSSTASITGASANLRL